MATYLYLDQGSGNDGYIYGQTTSAKISFYAATPIVQPSGAAQATSGVVSVATLSGTVWGFSCSATYYGAVGLLEAMRTALVNLGLIKGSA